jgi:hypothetical protein
MSQLRSCSECGGLVPVRLAACPNCDAPSRSRGRIAGVIAGVVGGGALMMTLMACYGLPAKCDPADDKDGDGFCPATKRQRDCDDTNKDIHPGATDTAGDGVDQNCDGVDSTP